MAKRIPSASPPELSETPVSYTDEVKPHVSTNSKHLEGVELVERAIEIVNGFEKRPLDHQGNPGGLIEFPSHLRPIIIGDLHTSFEHLEFALHNDHNKTDVESGKAAYIVVGDAVHNDQTGTMKDMTSSLKMQEEIFQLLIKYPKSFYYIRGNHDTFDERLRKSGIAQGLEFKNKLLAERGDEYVAAVERYFEALPIFLIGQGFVITHAGPVRGGCTKDQLINAKERPDIIAQLTWNRVNEFHGNPSPKEYGEQDIRTQLLCLDLDPMTHFIVGHNVLNDGNRTGCWLNVIGIKNHHILYSGHSSRGPYLTFKNGELEVHLSKHKEAEMYNYG